MKTPHPLLMLALMAGTFALPFALGAGLYASGWQPARTVNHGELIRPPQALPADGLTAPDGSPLNAAELQGRWWLLLAAAGPCEAACIARAADMRRIHVSLNKDMPRLKRMVLAGDPGEGSLAALRDAQPDLVVARPDVRWQRTLGEDGVTLYLVDPQARLILRYPPQIAATAIRADVARLLRYSAGS